MKKRLCSPWQPLCWWAALPGMQTIIIRLTKRPFSTPEGSDFEVTRQGGWHIYALENPKAGLVFYPGGKVDHLAYEPLMKACAAWDILCVLVEIPLRQAVLDADAGARCRKPFLRLAAGTSAAILWADPWRLPGRASGPFRWAGDAGRLFHPGLFPIGCEGAEYFGLGGSGAEPIQI